MKTMLIYTNFKGEEGMPRTTMTYLDDLAKICIANDCKKVSIRGYKEDPLEQYLRPFNFYWWKRLFRSVEYNDLLLEVNTSVLTNESAFPYNLCHRVVYNVLDPLKIALVHKVGKEELFVVCPNANPEVNPQIDHFVSGEIEPDTVFYHEARGYRKYEH